MPITLTIVRGPEVGRQFTFAGPGTFLIGRSTRAQFMLPSGDAGDLRVSHTHCLVEFSPMGCRVYDLNSHNGTFVDGRRVTIADLGNGAELRVGQTNLKIVVARDTPPETVDWHGESPGKPPSRAIPSRPMLPSKPTKPGGDAKARTPDRPTPSDSGDVFDRSTLKPRRGVKPTETTSAVPPSSDVCPACRGRHELSSGEPLCVDCINSASREEQLFPNYRLIREVGRGAMGVVFLGWSELSNQPVAMKVIHPAMALKSAQAERFVREAAILKQLDHPNIVGFREAGYVEGVLFLAMEFVHGRSAANALTTPLTRNGLAKRLAVSLLCELLQALEYAHAKRFVHRDLKPANLLIHRTGPDRLGLKLADFGLARVYESSELSGLTGTNEVGGTTAYMPPEQVLDYRNVKPPADQYSAAATLYTLLTGERVYDQPPTIAQQLKQILDEDPVPIMERKRKMPKALAAVVMKALSRNPADRFPDVKAFREALQPFAG